MNNLNLDNILSNRLDKDFLIQLFQEQKEVHTAAIQVALSNKQPQAWRATWILTHCTSKNDSRIIPYISNFIEKIPKQKDGQQRETIKILDKMKLNDEQEGKLFDICMSIWENLAKAPAVRYLAFKFIHKTCQKYPELSGEMSFISQDQYLETLSPGIQKNVKKIIKTGK
ncbi:hypothetical protein [Wenyingzhuangia marina]|uniref:HEAT repeat-containing protein n=1 Tax=Wenyingzhuangia marina TaxID=1195760 RepID=A0A1M5VWW3_9FLAO|nr:hypothetical protein [Wenyingzhuangia marina]GGF77333.1 hypothetical protein GCM10011397_20460 [Wenyingzhuangia marina]SHH79698.1 hypothetical protein SAMN05444281_2019 [Wenyingzhuangia marina]